MASPNYDILSVRLSRMIDDPAATASANGQSISSAQRDRALNAAINKWVRLSCYTKRWAALRAYIRTASGNLTSSKVLSVSSFSPTVYVIKSVYNTTQSKPVEPLPSGTNRQEVENPLVSGLFSNLYWVWENSDIVVLRGATSDAVKAEYVKNHTDLSAGGSSDIEIDSAYWDEILDFALKVLAEEKPTATNLAIAQIKNQEAKENIATTGADSAI